MNQGYVTAMVDHMESLLTAQASSSAPLAFVAMFPAWDDKPCWRRFNDSPFKR